MGFSREQKGVVLSYQDEIRQLHERLAVAREVQSVIDAEIERREDEGVDVREGLGNPDAEARLFAYSASELDEPFTGAASACWCQNAYDTGFTGNAAIDRRLAYHYEGWLDPDCIRRDYDHYAKHIPYVEHSSRRPYCFQSKKAGTITKPPCNHEACEHARHRAPETVKRMRFFIEEHCPAQYHYPHLDYTETGQLLPGVKGVNIGRIERSGDTRPEMDNGAYRMAQWDEVEYEWHHRNPQADGRAYDPEACPKTRTRPVRLQVISQERFWEDLVDAEMTPVAYQVLGDFLTALWGKPEAGEYTVSFDPEKLAEIAAVEASEALFAEAEAASELTEWWARANRVRRSPDHLKVEG